MINIINKIKNYINSKLQQDLKEKENIIKEYKITINDLEFSINSQLNELERTLVDINGAIDVLELPCNDKKPEVVYRKLKNAKLKIKSSIADSKTLLNKYNLKYIPRTNFTIINLENQEGGIIWQKEECSAKD